MANPFKRTPHRPTLRPAPGQQSWEVESEPAIEVTEGDEDSDWAMWEDSVQQFESSGVTPLDPFEGVGKRDK